MSTEKKTSNNDKNDDNDIIELVKHSVTEMHEDDYYIYNFNWYLNTENVKV